MANNKIVAFKEAGEQYAEPEIYLCLPDEADAIEELLGLVCDEGSGSIDTLSYKGFVEKVRVIRLKELKNRFAAEEAEARNREDEVVTEEEVS